MHLVLDVGNTDTVVGVFHPESLEPVARTRYPTPPSAAPGGVHQLIRDALQNMGFPAGAVSRVVVGSVVSTHYEQYRQGAALLGDPEVVTLDGVSGLPIRLDPDDPAQGVGVDRIANAVAAAHLYQRDTIIVDLGTANTFDCLSEEGLFLGGVIAAGVPAGQAWLEGRIASLPLVVFGPPARVVGRRTEECLGSGIFFSVVDAIEGIIRRIRSEWARPDTFVIGTGGYAKMIASHSSTFDEVNPDLTLVGLKIAGDHRATTSG